MRKAPCAATLCALCVLGGECLSHNGKRRGKRGKWENGEDETLGNESWGQAQILVKRGRRARHGGSALNEWC